MLNCRKATRLLSDRLDRPLTLKENVHLKIHLLWCSGCRNFGGHMHRMRNISRGFVDFGADDTTPDGGE